MRYYTHTATRPDGTSEPDQSQWQLLHNSEERRPDHLDDVAGLVAEFVTLPGIKPEIVDGF